MTDTVHPTIGKPRRARAPLILAAAALVGVALGGGALMLARLLGDPGAPAARAGARATAEPAGAVHGADAEVDEPRWRCPMHPGVAQDHAGECPSCGMRLVEVRAGDDGAPEGAAPPAPGEDRHAVSGGR